jgi:hypothetical protein
MTIPNKLPGLVAFPVNSSQDVDDFDLDLDGLILPPQQQRADINPQPFVSQLLVERDAARESQILQKYMDVISSSVFKENPVAYIKILIEERKSRPEKWEFPGDDVLKRLKEEFGIQDT